jgi:hypothetical protein
MVGPVRRSAAVTRPAGVAAPTRSTVDDSESQEVGRHYLSDGAAARRYGRGGFGGIQASTERGAIRLRAGEIAGGSLLEMPRSGQDGLSGRQGLGRRATATLLGNGAATASLRLTRRRSPRERKPTALRRQPVRNRLATMPSQDVKSTTP